MTFTWKHVLVELALLAVAMYMVAAGCSAGWLLLGLRNGAMFAWSLLIVLPSAMAPFALWKFRFERRAFQ